MERLRDILQELAELNNFTEVEMRVFLSAMPQDANGCNIYSGQSAYTLLYKMSSSMRDLGSIHYHLAKLHEEKQYRLMHAYLIMYYASVEVELPPFFLEFALDEHLLEMLLYEYLMDFQEYIEELEMALEDWEEEDAEEDE